MSIFDLLSNSASGIIFAICLSALVGIITLVAIVFIIRFIRGTYGSGEVKDGVTATATITRIWDTGTTINENPLAGIQLEVKPANEAPFTVETKQIVNRLEVGYFQPGQTVTVSYNPTDHKKIHIIGLEAAEAASASSV